MTKSKRILIAILALCALGFAVWIILKRPQRETLTEDSSIVRRWKAMDYYVNGCRLSHDSCQDVNVDEVELKADDMADCLRCAGYVDEARGRASCTIYCRIKSKPFTRVTQTGCVCGDLVSVWDMSHCEHLSCGEFGFKQVESGAWIAQ